MKRVTSLTFLTSFTFLTFPGVQQPGPTTAETAIELPSSEAVPAVRRFKRGAVAAYAYTIYNARLDKAMAVHKDEVSSGCKPRPEVSRTGNSTPFGFEVMNEPFMASGLGD